MSRGRLLVVLLVAAAVVVFFAAGGHRYLSLENLKAQQAALQDWRAAAPGGGGGRVLRALRRGDRAVAARRGAADARSPAPSSACSGERALVSFASSIGATLAFLASRFVLRDWVQARFGAQLRAIDRGVEKRGRRSISSRCA